MEIDLSLAQIERLERALTLYEATTTNEEKHLTNSLIGRIAELKNAQVKYLVSIYGGN